MTNNKTPSRKEMIDTIYEKISDKTLSFGCKIDLGIAEGVVYRTTQGGGIVDFFIGIQLKSAFTQELIKNSQIIGHPVMIGDVLDYFEKNSHQEDSVFSGNTLKIGITKEKKIEILNYNLNIFWKDKRKPIEEQSSDCIEFVYNLIS